MICQGDPSQKVIGTRKHTRRMKRRKLFGREKGIKCFAEKVSESVSNFRGYWHFGPKVTVSPRMTYQKNEHSMQALCLRMWAWCFPVWTGYRSHINAVRRSLHAAETLIAVFAVQFSLSFNLTSHCTQLTAIHAASCAPAENMSSLYVHCKMPPSTSFDDSRHHKIPPFLITRKWHTWTMMSRKRRLCKDYIKWLLKVGWRRYNVPGSPSTHGINASVSPTRCVLFASPVNKQKC